MVRLERFFFERNGPTTDSISCPFHHRSLFSQNHFEMWYWTNREVTSICDDPSMCWCGRHSFHRAHSRVITWPTVVWKWLCEKWNDCAEHFGSQLNKTQVCASKRTVRCSDGFLVSQFKSWTTWELVKMEQRAKWDKQDEDGENQWHKLERKVGSVK